MSDPSARAMRDMKLLPENELACRPRAGIDSWKSTQSGAVTRRFDPHASASERTEAQDDTAK